MPIHYDCSTPRRRQALTAPVDAQGNPVAPSINGIDFVEVSPDQLTLFVHFFHPLPAQPGGVPAAPPLELNQLRIEGGIRIRDIHILQITANDKVLEIQVDTPGDFSPYKLRLVSAGDEDTPPAGFDPQFSEISFSFKVDCPSEFDCKSDRPCPPPVVTSPELNYLARDYASFRRLVLDRLSIIMPDWRERNPADLGVTLVELLAHMGDLLSYYQDAVATEAYLGTARQRRSVRRHARMLDYVVHDGCNARAWVAFGVEPGGGADGAALPAATMLLTRATGRPVAVPAVELDAVLAGQPAVFETLEAVTLRANRNAIPFYTWSDAACCLARGSTEATLLNEPDAVLLPGDVLVFEEVRHPVTGLAADARRAYRHPVRLVSVEVTTDPLTSAKVVNISWDAEDALPFDLQLSSIVGVSGGTPELVPTSVARGNVVLADHGRTLTDESLIPAEAPADEPYRPRLGRSGLSYAVPYSTSAARSLSAAATLRQDPRSALPVVRLTEANQVWTPRPDLLGSDRFAQEFVVETEVDGSALLRFGDDTLGKRPAVGTVFSVSYRIGNGAAGNLGADAIGRVVTDLTGFLAVWNPLPAGGGTEPESMEEIRQFAPQAFRRQERAVTVEDWVEVTERHPEVQRAAATFRWTGSWYTVFVTIDRKGGRLVDASFEQEIREHLERYRLAGYDLEVDGPVFVPLEIALTICVKPGFFRSDIQQELNRVLGTQDLPDGRRGFFHPDNFTFGQTVFLSRLIKVVLDVEGVASVVVDRFQRLRLAPAGELARGFLTTDRLEIARCDNDPNFPENGHIELNLHGGL